MLHTIFIVDYLFVSGEIIVERIGLTIAPVSQCTRHLFNACPFFYAVAFMRYLNLRGQKIYFPRSFKSNK